MKNHDVVENYGRSKLISVTIVCIHSSPSDIWMCSIVYCVSIIIHKLVVVKTQLCEVSSAANKRYAQHNMKTCKHYMFYNYTGKLIRRKAIKK